MNKKLACPFCEKAGEATAVCVGFGFCGVIGPWRTMPKPTPNGKKQAKKQGQKR